MERGSDHYFDKVSCGFAVIGCGVAAGFHLAAIRQIDDARLIGVFDHDFANAESVAQKYGVRAYKSYEEVLSDPAVDVISVCVPSHLHAPFAARGIQAGKAVLVEKPLALTLEDCDRLIELAGRHGTQVGVVSQLRFSPAVAKVKKALRDGVLGRLTRADLYMKYYRSQAYYDRGGWRGTADKDGGGALMNQGIHGVDLLRYLAGPADTIYAMSRTRIHEIEVEDTLSAVLSFQSGALGVLEASTADWPGAPRRLELNGEYGVIVLEEDYIARWEVEGEKVFTSFAQKPSASKPFQNPEMISAEGHTAQIRNFISALRGETELLVDAYEGRKALEIVLAAYASAETNTIVKINK